MSECLVCGAFSGHEPGCEVMDSEPDFRAEVGGQQWVGDMKTGADWSGDAPAYSVRQGEDTGFSAVVTLGVHEGRVYLDLGEERLEMLPQGARHLAEGLHNMAKSAKPGHAGQARIE